jgi:ElaB/YqjD/DUF883 family membrane-anchored ribosome-binding protein
MMRTAEYTTSSAGYPSIKTLLRNLAQDTRAFIRQEVQLAKAELSEKLSYMGRNAVSLAIGGFMAYAGLIVVLAGLGLLAGWGLEKAGLNPALGACLGLAGVGLIVITIGVVMLMKGVRAFSMESLAPERTLHTLQDLRGKSSDADFYQDEEADASEEQREDEDAPDADELESQVRDTEKRMGATLDQLSYRLSPAHLKNRVQQQVKSNPYRYGGIALATGVALGLMIRRRLKGQRRYVTYRTD